MNENNHDKHVWQIKQKWKIKFNHNQMQKSMKISMIISKLNLFALFSIFSFFFINEFINYETNSIIHSCFFCFLLFNGNFYLFIPYKKKQKNKSINSDQIKEQITNNKLMEISKKTKQNQLYQYWMKKLTEIIKWFYQNNIKVTTKHNENKWIKYFGWYSDMHNVTCNNIMLHAITYISLIIIIMEIIQQIRQMVCSKFEKKSINNIINENKWIKT